MKCMHFNKRLEGTKFYLYILYIIYSHLVVICNIVKKNKNI